MRLPPLVKRKGRRLLENNRWLAMRMPEAIRRRFEVPIPGKVKFGDLRRLHPIDPEFGFSRGLVVDRYYIEGFLERHKADIRGRVLEIGVSIYTKRFGGDGVTEIDVLHYVEGNPEATIVADLTDGEGIESDSFDCIILTQTLQMIYDFQRAIATIHRILKPGGVVLVSAHGTSKIARHEGDDEWGEYWRFTQLSARLAFEKEFGARNVEAVSFGNVLTATATIHGISADELTKEELDYRDKNFEVVVAVRAVKANPTVKAG